ncbi:MAG TPA: hypothetical protein DEB56_05505 [Thiobacillus sp.]|nr:hypothetical protein [Thiobacillus sp.]
MFLVNPSGVVFGPGARVDVGGLVASTLDMRDDDFLAGNNRFDRNGATGSVVNQGELLGKYVALLAPEVRNEGVIVARQGTAALAAGDAVTLSITGTDLVGVQVDRATLDTLVENRHLIQADAGTVILSAQSAHGLLGRVVNSGAIEANGITTDGGTVRLVASSTIEHSGSIQADAGANGNGGDVVVIADLSNPDSRTTVSGSLSARGGSDSGNGGFVETSASTLKIEASTRVNTSAANGLAGTWLLDPTDFTVAASGGDMDGATLTTNLSGGNVTIQSGTGASGTNGDVFVNDTVSWSANTLTIQAHRNANVNATMTVTGTGGLAVEYGQGAVEAGNTANFTVNAPVNMASTTSFSTKLGSDGATKTYTLITNLAGLTGIDANATTVTENYALGTNIVLSGDWTPIGNSVGPFDGIFDGLGHTISGVTYDASTAGGMSPYDNVGFFGQTGNSARIQNIGVTNVNITGRTAVGALVGNNSGIIYNAYSTGNVALDGGVTGADPVFGIGGLVGMTSGKVIRSYSSATVTANGGEQTVQDDPFTMLPGSSGYGLRGGIGGLVGIAQGDPISNSYATGSVSGILDVGGLVGYAAAPVEYSYATGAVSGTTNPGGLIGAIDAAMTVADSFWDTDTSLQGTSAGAETGLTTAQMQTAANFSAWDTTIWNIQDGSYPVFNTGPAAPVVGPSAITISLDDTTRVYGDTTQPTLTGFSYTGSLLAGDGLSGAGWGSALTDYLDVGVYAYSTADLIAPTFTFAGGHTLADYSVSYSSNKLTVTPRPITVTATPGQSKVYNGLGGADPTLTYSVSTDSLVDPGTPLVNGDTLSGALARAAGSNVGSYAINKGTLANGNYDIAFVADTFAITPKALTVTGTTAADKTYDGSATAAITAGTLSGFVGTETVTATATGTFDSKDAGPRTATATYTLADGSNGGVATNYSLANTTGHTATIAKKAIDLSVTKTYDGNADFTTGFVLDAGDIIGSDTVSVSGGSASVISANANAYGSFAGSTLALSNANYTLTGGTVSATITPKTLTVTGTTAAGKTYDGTPTATINVGTLSGFVGTETVTATATGTFDSKDADLRTATATYTLADGTNGGLAGNYSLADTGGHAATITTKALSLLDLTFAASPTDTSATSVGIGDSVLITSGSASGAIFAGDAVSVVFSPDTNAEKTITALTATPLGGPSFDVTANRPAALALAGDDAGNYTLTGATMKARVTAASSTSTTVAAVVNSGQSAGTQPTSTTVSPTTTTVRPPTTAAAQTTAPPNRPTTTAPPPAQTSGRTSNPTPNPGETVPIAVPASSGSGLSVLDATKPVAAVMMPASGAADIPMPTPTITVNADGSLSISVTVPTGTPPGVYLIAVVGTDAEGRSRAVIVPVVVRRVRAA